MCHVARRDGYPFLRINLVRVFSRANAAYVAAGTSTTRSTRICDPLNLLESPFSAEHSADEVEELRHSPLPGHIHQIRHGSL